MVIELQQTSMGALEGWFRAHLPEVRLPLESKKLEGGRSNLTYSVVDAAGWELVVRRPPAGEVLASAHDVVREYRVQAALAGTEVPVPRVLGVCDDPDVLGVPFYVMERVPGTVLRSVQDVEAVGPPDRTALAADVVRVLGQVHALDPEQQGLGWLTASRSPYVQRQLRRWQAQYDAYRRRHVPDLEELGDRLRRTAPPDEERRLVHGDYRLDNLITLGPGVAAVLDWELTTLGDPLADLAGLCIYWAEPSESRTALLAAPTAAHGFPSRTDIVAEYERVTGRDTSRLDYYLAFAYWRLAVILEGVQTRVEAGALGADHREDLSEEVEFLVARGAEAAREARL